MIRIELFASVSLFLLCEFLMGNVVFAAELDDKAIVATVNGTPIEYQQIKFTESSAVKDFQKKHRRRPETREDFLELKEYIRKREHRSFGGAIYDVLRKEQYRKYDITVSPEEIDSRIDAMYESDGIGKMFEQQKQMLIRVAAAIKAVREKGMDKEEAYRKFLENKGIYNVDRKGWEAFLNMPPEKMAEAENKVLHWNIEDHKKSRRPSVTKSILEKKLFWEITEELKEKDPKYVSYRAKYGREKADDRYGELYWWGKKGSWWLKRYQEADIDIKVPEFETVLEESIKLWQK